jgi:O-antigen ligase
MDSPRKSRNYNPGSQRMRAKNNKKTSQAAPAAVRRPWVRIAEICVLVGLHGALLTPLFFARGTAFPFVFPKALFFQAVVDLTFPAWAALALWDRRYRPTPSALLWAILAWVLAMTLATCFGVNPRLSLFSSPERMTGLWTQLHVLAWFAMAAGTLKTAAQRDRLLGVQLAVAFLTACIAIAQSADPTFVALGQVAVGDRLSGTLGNPIYLGGYEALSIFFALSLLPDAHGALRGLLLTPILTALWALALAGSRGPALGLGAGLVVLVIVLGMTGRHRRLVVVATASLLVVAAAYGLFVGLIASRPSMGPFWARHENLRHLFCLTEVGRFQLWTAAWDGFLRRPVLGWGVGGYEIAFDSVFRPAYHPLGYHDKAHNVLLGAFCETGAIGAIAYLVMWATFAVTVVRGARGGSLTWARGAALLGAGAGYLVYSMFAPDGISTDLTVAVIFAAVATSTPEAGQQRATTDHSLVSLKAGRLIQLGVLSASALAILWFGSLSPFLSSTFVRKAMDGASRNSGAVTVGLLERAGRLTTPYLDDQVAAVVGFAEGSLQTDAPTRPQQEILVGMALEATEKHLGAGLSRGRYRAYLADAFANIGRGTGRVEMEKRAESLYLQNIAESPNRQTYRFAYAKFLAGAGRLDAAEEQYRKALAAAPRMGESLWSLGRFLWSERKQAREGSRLMVESTEVSEYDRFLPQSPLEILQLAQALAAQGRRDKLAAMADALQSGLPNDAATAEAWVEIARVMENLGLLVERDKVLRFAQAMNLPAATAGLLPRALQ